MVTNSGPSSTRTSLLRRLSLRLRRMMSFNESFHKGDLAAKRQEELQKQRKMKSMSVDYAEMPNPMRQGGEGHKRKLFRTPHRLGDSIDMGRSFEQSVSPSRGGRLGVPPSPRVATRQQQKPSRRLPQVPQQQSVDQYAQKPAISRLLHIVTHEYVSGDCMLLPGDRMMVVDNGDPDWKHGFKMSDRLEQLLSFPGTCVASFQPDEQPMRLIQSCNLFDQKLRLYRDQVVFVQPDSLNEDGRVLIRNEHDKFAHCPLQFLTLT